MGPIEPAPPRTASAAQRFSSRFSTTLHTHETCPAAKNKTCVVGQKQWLDPRVPPHARAAPSGAVPDAAHRGGERGAAGVAAAPDAAPGWTHCPFLCSSPRAPQHLTCIAGELCVGSSHVITTSDRPCRVKPHPRGHVPCRHRRGAAAEPRHRHGAVRPSAAAGSRHLPRRAPSRGALCRGKRLRLASAAAAPHMAVSCVSDASVSVSSLLCGEVSNG